MSPKKGPSRIRERRDELGLTQMEVARKIGTSQQGYHEIESGVREPMISTVLRIARALDSTMEELFPEEIREEYIRMADDRNARRKATLASSLGKAKGKRKK